MKKLTLGLLLFISVNAVAQIISHDTFINKKDTCWMMSIISKQPILANQCRLLITVIDKDGVPNYMASMIQNIIKRPSMNDFIYEAIVQCMPHNIVYNSYTVYKGITYVAVQIEGEDYRPMSRLFSDKLNMQSEQFDRELAETEAAKSKKTPKPKITIETK